AFERRCIRSSFVAQVRRTLPVRLHLRALLARRIDALDASGYLRDATLLAAIAFLLAVPGVAHPAGPAGKGVLVATIAAPIGPVTADYLSAVIARAEEEDAALLVVELDTPGGLDSAMREMVQAILKSRIPVAVYVSPQGARSASAGVLITLAADVAAMAPGTNIGAAHPVNLGGGGMDNTMSRKVENDAAAYARSLAAGRGRNADWAESAVRESASLSEKDALDRNVVDLVAASLTDLLARIDGRVIRKGGETVTLRTKDAPVVRAPMGLRHRVLSALANPNIAYILMMIGVYGIYFELASPGAVFPGVVGGISLLLGFYALQTLSANYAGFLLILLSLILFFLELKAQTHGALAIGGIVSMALGSLMLFRESADPYVRISWTVLTTMVALSAVFFAAVISLAVRSQLRKPTTGREGMVGETGEAVTDIDPKGKVHVVGELWDARCDRPVRKGDRVVVKAVDGMTLIVDRREGPAEPPQEGGAVR
ncbi:nodulation protein NfeD, partial [Candidatus Deferrimicrobium sp.]|uniref:NfeD family protein n=1 Tax=Candidatus Deferrimicrobium sp. TaxID=3060586 RepID=UPI002EDAF94B